MAGPGPQRAETLHDLFDLYSIQLGEMPRANFNHGGARSRLYCPQCQGGQHKERNFFVKIDPDLKGATWQCFRASCGITGGGRLANAPAVVQKPAKLYRRPPPLPRPPLQTPDSLVTYFEGFGISETTLQAFQIVCVDHAMPVIDRHGVEVDDRWETRRCIAYPYIDAGELVNVKYKAVYPRGGKLLKRFVQEKAARPSLFNIDAFTDPEGIAVIVEGEDDVLVMHEVGYLQATTLANGAPKKLSQSYDPATDTDERYSALVGEDRLAKLGKILLAGDMDQAGMNHREEIARRVGKWRCWSVTWPEGCKDAKETLQRLGRDAVHSAIEAAVPYPLDGVAQVELKTLLDLQAGRIGKRFVTGYFAIDERVSLTDAGSLIICTGVPGHGKSLFWNAMGVFYAEAWERNRKDEPTQPPFHTVVFSGETAPERVMLDLISMHAQKPMFPNAQVAHLAPEEVAAALPWVNRHFTFLRWVDAEREAGITWITTTVREIVRSTRAKLFILDPIQEVDDEMPVGERDPSRWIGKMLGRLRALAYELGVNIVVVVHPAKRRRVEGKFLMPLGDDIAESRFYATKCHIGITLHRPDLKSNTMLLHTWKAKDTLYARSGDSELEHEPLSHRLWPKPQLVDALQNPPEPHWSQEAG